MSLQSMFNSMIGNIGVQTSILKNRLRPEEDASISQKKAPKSAPTKKTVNETPKAPEEPQKAVEQPTTQKRGPGRPKGSKNKPKEMKVFQDHMHEINTYREQAAGLKFRMDNLGMKEAK